MEKRSIAPNGEHVTYQLQPRKCGKKPCKTCEHGQGHGPYWYAYWRRKEDGRITSVYIGKNLPPEEYVSSEAQEGQPNDAPLTKEPVEATARSHRTQQLRQTEKYQPSPVLLVAALPV